MCRATLKRVSKSLYVLNTNTRACSSWMIYGQSKCSVVQCSGQSIESFLRPLCFFRRTAQQLTALFVWRLRATSCIFLVARCLCMPLSTLHFLNTNTRACYSWMICRQSEFGGSSLWPKYRKFFAVALLFSPDCRTFFQKTTYSLFGSKGFAHCLCTLLSTLHLLNTSARVPAVSSVQVRWFIVLDKVLEALCGGGVPESTGICTHFVHNAVLSAHSPSTSDATAFLARLTHILPNGNIW